MCSRRNKNLMKKVGIIFEKGFLKNFRQQKSVFKNLIKINYSVNYI